MSHFKLGLLALCTLAAIVAIALIVGIRSRPADEYHTYFDESVQGLEVGALVKYRGVKIGSVKAIDVAPDRRLVRVALAVERRHARALGLEARAPELRAQLVLLGLTGVKLVDLDVAGPNAPQPPSLAFPPGHHYIPSRRSLLAGLDTIGDRVPVAVERTIGVLEHLEGMLDDLRRNDLPDRIAGLVSSADGAIRELRQIARRVSRAELPERLAGVASKLDRLLGELGGEHGLVASAQRATDAVGDLGRATGASGAELEQTLRDVGEAARSIREFVEQLDRDPEMLLKGHARSHAP